MKYSHPLHEAVAKEIREHVERRDELLMDQACGSKQQLPLFFSARRGRETQICKVDLLVLKAGEVKVIVEVEESGFNPTKICGKFLTSALATHFIHDSRPEQILPFAKRAMFIQVLDSSKFLKDGSKKDEQASELELLIKNMACFNGSSLTEYRLFLVSGARDNLIVE